MTKNSYTMILIFYIINIKIFYIDYINKKKIDYHIYYFKKSHV